MVRAWGAQAGAPMELPGVRVAALQNLLTLDGHGIHMRFEGTVGADGKATMSVRKGKAISLCMDMENEAATLNDYFTRMELCGFQSDIESPNGTPKTSFDHDTTVTLELQNKYANVMAQLSDGYDYLKTVAGYTPHKLSALAGPIANTIGKLSHGRAMTPCLDFPNVALDGLNATLISAAEAVPVVGSTLATALVGVETAVEVDMWLPDEGGTLSSRGIGSHEYGHFAMCSMLYDEDWTKMVQIPSLIIQRIAEGSYEDATDQTAYLMEGWADFFSGQLVSGDSYYQPQNTLKNDFDNNVAMLYCNGSTDAVKAPCSDWNYVEDLDATPNWDGSGAKGFFNQVRRVATTLFDAFDGHPEGGNNPGDGDFWAQDMPTGLIVPASAHTGDAHDEVIQLPGSALRTIIHNWVTATWPLGWQVNEQQFFAALNSTIRGTQSAANPSQNYSWCDVCQMFSQHDSLSCTFTGNTAAAGFCTDATGNQIQPAISRSEMVAVCGSSPSIPGFIGSVPSADDPSSACTFGGCPARTILVGSIGDAGASCVACGPHQVATGAHVCSDSVCAAPNSSATTCVDCADDQIVGGPNGNTCVSCPALQVPTADKTACVACGPHQIAVGAACVTCAPSEVVSPDNTCQTCPSGQLPYSDKSPIGNQPVYGDTCIPAADCFCGSTNCREVNPAGICVNTIG
jgi:hypothetical protein